MKANYREKSFPRAVLELNLRGLKKNCRALKSLMPAGAFFCPMIKAGAYGHGAAAVARALIEEGARQAGVITVSEAWEIREFAPKPLNVLVFGPVLNREDMSWGLENSLVFVLSCWPDLEALAFLSAGQKAPAARAHLKFDTGFSRLGFAVSEAEKLKDFLQKNPQIRLEGLASQLTDGGDLGDEGGLSRRQLRRFLALRRVFPSVPFHALNTEAMISAWAHDLPHLSGARPGLGLYGLKPEILFAGPRAAKKAAGLDLAPVSLLKSHVAAVRCLSKGDRVSYSGEWRAARPSTVIAVAMGYGDGFFRGPGAKWQGRQVLFRGQRVPLAGRVCMDFFMADVTECLKGGQPPVRLGEEIALFGRQGGAFLSVEEYARSAGATPYEAFVSLGGRVQREYTEG